MAWTDPTRYPNSMEIADNEAFLNTNVIDNLVYLKANSGSDVIFAATATLTTPFATSNVINNWSNIVTTGATCNGTTITISAAGTYQVIASPRIINQNVSVAQTANIYLASDSTGFGTNYGRAYSGSIPIFQDVAPVISSVCVLSANATLVIYGASSSNTDVYWYGNNSSVKHSIVIRKIG